MQEAEPEVAMNPGAHDTQLEASPDGVVPAPQSKHDGVPSVAANLPDPQDEHVSESIAEY